MTSVSQLGISLPTEIITQTDAERGDIPRSRYILRILQNTYSNKRKLKEEGRRYSTVIENKNNSQDSPDRRLETLQSSESRSP